MMPAKLNWKETGMASKLPSAPRAFVLHGVKKWRTRWYDSRGVRRQHVLGPVAELSARQARARWQMWLDTQWKKHEHVRDPAGSAANYTVRQLAVDYLEFAKATFVKDGAVTSHVWNVMYGMQALLDCYGASPVGAFAPKQLAELRDSMIHRVDENGKYRRAIKTVNQRLYIIKEAFRWAVERGSVPADVAYHLMMVKPLQKGRSAARDPESIKPVDEHWVAVTKDKLPQVVRDMVDVQWLTGMRPEEVCAMRPADLDRSGDVWLYTPTSHKTEHLDKSRVICLGPQAQKLIERYLFDRKPTDFCFSPAEAQAQRLTSKRQSRKVPLYASHLARDVGAGANVVGIGKGYTSESYRNAVHHACHLAFPPPTDLKARAAAACSWLRYWTKENAKPKEIVGDVRAVARWRASALPPEHRTALRELAKWENSHAWNPNQLRHARATWLKKTFGIEAAKDTLGHACLDTTEIYAERDLERAMTIARKVG